MTTTIAGCLDCTEPQNCLRDLSECELERPSPTRYRGARGPVSIAKQARIQRVKEMVKTMTVDEIAAELQCTTRAVWNYIGEAANAPVTR